jgi:hypothetical protein
VEGDRPADADLTRGADGLGVGGAGVDAGDLPTADLQQARGAPVPRLVDVAVRPADDAPVRGQQLVELRSAAGAQGDLVLLQPVPRIVGSAASVAQPPRLT